MKSVCAVECCSNMSEILEWYILGCKLTNMQYGKPEGSDSRVADMICMHGNTWQHMATHDNIHIVI